MSLSWNSFSLLAVVLGAVLVPEQAGAQSLWGVDGPTATATQMTGPPAGPCAYPTGPVTGGFPYAVPFVCPTAAPFPPACAAPAGDIAVDRVTDTVYVTDGFIITEYTKAGAPLSSFAIPAAIPGPIIGMGWGLVGGASALWVTDGVLTGALFPPPPPGCPGIAVIAVPPRPNLIVPATDVDFDPISGTLFLSTAAGVISNELVAGGPGPFGLVPAPCGLAPCYSGIAVDSSLCGSLYVTDGVMVTHMMMGGGLAPPTFYTPVPCFPWAGPGPISGLAFDAAPISFGLGCSTIGPPPVAGAVGQVLSPSPGLALTLTGAAPGGVTMLLLSFGAACPPVPFGCGAVAAFPIALSVGPLPVPAAGTVTIPVPIGPGLMCLPSVYVQWIVAIPGGGRQVSQGLEMTLALP